MDKLLRLLFFALMVRPLALVIIGLNVRRRERPPKRGPAIIAANRNSHLDTLVLPIFLHGLRKALPKGEALLVPFFCDVFVGEPIHWQGDKQAFMIELDTRMHTLADEGKFASWA